MKPLTLADLDTAARTVWGEARGEPLEGQRAVACVIVNRWKRSPLSLYGVCRKPLQFSCWNADDPNRDKLEHLDVSDLLPQLQSVILALRGADVTNGATHYHERSIQPAWAVGHRPCATIGRHVFYNDVT